MQFIRRINRHIAMFWGLALLIGLRSLIAPGLMLNPDDNRPLGFGLTFCDGFESIDQGDFLADPHADQHAIHSHSEAVPHDHDTDTSHELAGHGCGLWFTSSLFVQALVFDVQHFQHFGPDQFQLDYHGLYSKNTCQKPQQPRAPPVSRII